jgi:hypothetical protein
MHMLHADRVAQGNKHLAKAADCVAQKVPYGPMIAEHCILEAGLQPNRKPAVEPLSDVELTALLAGVHAFEQWLAHCDKHPPKGYIWLKPAPETSLNTARQVACPRRADAAQASNDKSAIFLTEVRSAGSKGLGCATSVQDSSCAPHRPPENAHASPQQGTLLTRIPRRETTSRLSGISAGARGLQEHDTRVEEGSKRERSGSFTTAPSERIQTEPSSFPPDEDHLHRRAGAMHLHP